MADSADEASCIPLRDYAVIGDCHGAALVGRHGAIDWCCLARFDADPLFGRLIGGERSGYFAIQAAGEYRSTRRYLPGTNILETTFLVGGARAVLTDFMPVGRAGGEEPAALNAPHWLVRLLECRQGEIAFTLRYRPSGPGFTTTPLALCKQPWGVGTLAGPQLYSEATFAIADGCAEARVVLHAGERLAFVVTPALVEGDNPCVHADTLLKATRAFWQEWLGSSNYQGPYREAVNRSALVLKMLTYAPTGAIVAAPTTSLPELIGGERNWDYRYCWLRDTTFTLYALAALGYEHEAGRFNGFLSQCLQETSPQVQILYGIEYETELAEQTLDQLPGYCNSRPVRKGNAAYRQRQLDIYGEVLDWALLYRTLGGNLSDTEQALLKQMADQVAATWQQPGQGIWEMRGEPRQHVYSKIMCWVALDRAVRLFGSKEPWREARDALRVAIVQRGIDAERGHLKQTFELDGIDAAVLMAPIVGFPLEEETLRRTIDVVCAALFEEGFLRRYRMIGSDGLQGEEAAFLVCSFWLVDALLFLDRREEAIALFEKLLSAANDVGLLSEEIAPEDGTLLGNFPQALTHLAVIRSAFIIELHEKGGSDYLSGAHADRAQQHADTAKDPETLWVAFEKIRPAMEQWSDASLLPRFWEHDEANSRTSHHR